jgi:ubiquinone/menaquinone biosynthesis C-methylase UbiE
MKDLVQNRQRMTLGQKLKLATLAVKENGVQWTLLLGVYGAASAVADRAFGGMQRLRAGKHIPGMNSREMNRAIWESWNWDGGGDEWTPSPEWKESLMRCILRSAIPQGSTVIEIGPGAGRWTGEILKLCGKYTAYDISRTCVELCSRQFADQKHAAFQVTDGCSLPGAENGATDVVWSFDVFVHINAEDVAVYLKEIHRVLKPGGHAVIHHGSKAGELGGWRSNLTTARMRELAAEAGLEVISQVDGWQDGDVRHDAGLYEDIITTLRKPAHG